MNRSWRLLLAIVFVACMAICGFFAGAFLGGRFLLPPNSGLAGAATVLAYGLGGAVLAAILGIVLARALPTKWFLGIVIPVTALGVGLGVFLISALLQSEAETRAELEEAYARLPHYTATLVHRDATGAAFARLDIDWGERRYTAVTADDPARTCSAALSGRESVALLESLRGVEGVVLVDASPCAGTSGTAERDLTWFIPAPIPPDSTGSLAITPACATDHPALVAPFEIAARIVSAGDHPRECR